MWPIIGVESQKQKSTSCKYLNEDFGRAGAVQATLMYDIQTTRQVVDGIWGKT